jgi:hypothetical protein
MAAVGDEDVDAALLREILAEEFPPGSSFAAAGGVEGFGAAGVEVSEQELNAILFEDAAAHNAGVSPAAAEDTLEHGPAATGREILPLSAPSLAPAWDDAWTAGIPPGGLDEPPLAAPSSARAEDVSFQEHGGESPGRDSAEFPRNGALEAWDGGSAGSGSGSGAGKGASCGGEWKEGEDGDEDEDEDEDDSDEEEVMALHADAHTDTLAALGGAPSCVALGPLALAVGVGARVAVLPAPWDKPGAAPTVCARALALPDADRDAVTCLALEPGAGNGSNGGALGPAGLLAGFASGGLAVFCAQSGALLRALPGAHRAAVLHVRCCAPRGGRSAFVSADATGVVMTHEATRGLLRLRVDSTTLLDGSARDDGPRTGAILALAVPPRAAADALRAPGAAGAAPPAVAMCSLEMAFVAQLAPRTRVACKARPVPRAPRPAALIAHGEPNLSRDWSHLSPAPRALRAVGSASAARPAPRRGGCRAPAPARNGANGSNGP